MVQTEPFISAATERETKIAVLIPCYNEERTIAEVVNSFRAELPNATIYVFDNDSTDRTSQEAAVAGASVFREPRRGKGYVIQSMFRRIDADVYVIVDGDNTYPPAAVHQLISPIVDDDADMVVGSRLHSGTRSEFTPSATIRSASMSRPESVSSRIAMFGSRSVI